MQLSVCSLWHLNWTIFFWMNFSFEWILLLLVWNKSNVMMIIHCFLCIMTKIDSWWLLIQRWRMQFIFFFSWIKIKIVLNDLHFASFTINALKTYCNYHWNAMWERWKACTKNSLNGIPPYSCVNIEFFLSFHSWIKSGSFKPVFFIEK